MKGLSLWFNTEGKYLHGRKGDTSLPIKKVSVEIYRTKDAGSVFIIRESLEINHK